MTKLFNKLWKLATPNPLASVLSLYLVCLLGTGVICGLVMAGHHFSKDTRSALVRQFEDKREVWAANPKPVTFFLRELRTGQLKSVGRSSDKVLYTDKAGGHYMSPLDASEVDKEMLDASVKEGFDLEPIEYDDGSMGVLICELLAISFISMLPVGFVASLVRCAIPDEDEAALVLRPGATASEDEDEQKPTVRFDDVIGAEQAKRALHRVRAFMKDPSKYEALGARAPRGVLLEGPPGTGKTLLAKALAGECGASFIAVDGSHFSTRYFGDGITKVDELFRQARRSAPCVLFFDEFDGVGTRTSGPDMSGGEGEQNRIINRLLTYLDGFEARDNIIVVAATNHAANIDPALKRPGRLDLLVTLQLPSLAERTQLFELYLKKIKTDGALDTAALARASAGVSPADIANILNRAASTTAEAGGDFVTEERVREALEAHQLGGEVSSLKDVLTPATRKRIAVHEAGHALVAHALNAGAVERVSIEPRGSALGVTFVSRHTEEPLYGHGELTSRLAMLLAGREAELLELGNTSSGASDDLKRASELAASMVGSMGFSEAFGLLSLDGLPTRLVGPDVQRALLDETRAALDAAQKACRKVLDERREALQAMTEALLVGETIGGALLQELLNKGAATKPALKLAQAA